MTDLTLHAQSRTTFGKGAARKIRRAGQIPAVMYGHGAAPVHITLPGHDTMLALKHANALLTIVLDGNEQLALAKDVQRDPIKPVIEHVDLVVVRRGEKVTVDIPVHIEGEAASDTVVQVESQTLQVEAEATHIPEIVTISVEGLAAGTQISAGQVALPAGSTLVTDPETLVVNVTAQVSAEQLEAELAEAEAEVGIVHEPTEEELAAEAEPAAEGEGGGESAEGAAAPAAEGDKAEA